MVIGGWAWTNAAASTAPAGCTRLVLTGHPAYPPVAWAEGATLDGAAIEVVRRLSKDAGVSLAVVNEGSWDGAQRAVRDGKADAIVGVYLTAQRAAYLDYVRPALAPDPSAVLVRVGTTFHYAGWNSLIGKRGVLGAGESFGASFDEFLRTKLTTYRVNGDAAVYRGVVDGRADYGLTGYYAALIHAPKEKIVIAAPKFVTENLYLAFGKRSPCSELAPAFSKDIARMAADGTIARLFAAALSTYPRPTAR